MRTNKRLEEKVSCTSRRQLLKIGGQLFGLALSWPLAGCLFARNPHQTEAEPEEVLGRIDDNHEHWVRLSHQQIEAGEALVVDITGTSTHPHTISLSAEHLAQIRKGKYVYVRSTVDWGHEHGVHFNAPS